MTKTTNITIQSLVINVNVTQAAAKEAGFDGLVGMLIHRAVDAIDDVVKQDADGADGEGSDDIGAGTTVSDFVKTGAAASDNPAKDIAEFLAGNPKFKSRTGTSVIKHFGFDNAVIRETLDAMINDGLVVVRTRRSDKEALLALADGITIASFDKVVTAAAEPAPVEVAPVAEAADDTPVAAKPEVSFDNVVAFLVSDTTKAKRSLKAIAKHFGLDNEDMTSVMDEMEEAGLVKRYTKRSDRSRLYGPVKTDSTPAVTADGILTFLHSDPRYTLRTGDSIARHFATSSAAAIDQALLELLASGKVAKKAKRRSRASVYKALVPAPVVTPEVATDAVTPAATPALTTDNLLAFLRSDPRYTKRTVASVAKYFGVAETSDEFQELLDDADHITTNSVRRRDSASMLSAN